MRATSLLNLPFLVLSALVLLAAPTRGSTPSSALSARSPPSINSSNQANYADRNHPHINVRRQADMSAPVAEPEPAVAVSRTPGFKRDGEVADVGRRDSAQEVKKVSRTPGFKRAVGETRTRRDGRLAKRRIVYDDLE